MATLTLLGPVGSVPAGTIVTVTNQQAFNAGGKHEPIVPKKATVNADGSLGPGGAGLPLAVPDTGTINHEVRIGDFGAFTAPLGASTGATITVPALYILVGVPPDAESALAALLAAHDVAASTSVRGHVQLAVDGLATASRVVSATDSRVNTVLTPEAYGATGVSVAADTAGLQAAIDAAAAVGGVVRGRAGRVYDINAALVPKSGAIVDFTGSTLRAVASMEGIFTSAAATNVIGFRLIGGKLNANGQAGRGVWLKYARKCYVQDIDIDDPTLGYVWLGDPAAAGNTYENTIANLMSRRSAATTVPAGSIGIYIQNASDNRVSGANIIDVETGIYNSGGNNQYTDAHVWSRVDDGLLLVTGFRSDSNDARFFNCVADTPSQYGWRLGNFRQTLVGCHTYNNQFGSDNLISGIFIESGDQHISIIGCNFFGHDSSHRILNDIAFEALTETQFNSVYIDDSTWNNCTNRTLNTPRWMSRPSSDINQFAYIYRGNQPRWGIGVPSGGNNLEIRRHNSSGVYQDSPLQISSIDGDVTFPTAVEFTGAVSFASQLPAAAIPPFNPSTTVQVYEDFILGTGGFTAATSGTGAGASANSGNTDNGGNPGWGVVSTGTTTTGRAAFMISGGFSSILLGRGAWVVETIARLPILSDGTETFTLLLGLNDTASGAMVDGVAFRYTHAVNGGRWECVARNNATETVVDSGVSVAATTNYKLRIEINAAGTSAQFFINGASVGTITTNIPTASGRQTTPSFGIIKSAGTTSRDLLLDYIYLRCDLTTAR